MSRGRGWSFWLLLLFLVVLYFVLHLGFGYGAVVPDLLTIALLLAARRLRPASAAAVGFTLGLMRDSLSLVAFGVDAIALTILGYLGARSRDFFIGESLVFVAVYLTVGKLLHDVIYYLIAGPALGDAGLRFFSQLPLVIYAAGAGLTALLLHRFLARAR